MTVRHLTYHVYPAKHNDGWRWNLQQLAQRWEVFNGKTILSVAVDNESESAFTVIGYLASLGIVATRMIVIDNDPVLREVASWPQVLDELKPESASPDEVVFTAHSKGVSYSEFDNELRNWADLMYQVCLDDIERVDASLKEYVTAGAFRRIGESFPGLEMLSSHWHYSGTFFWWKPAELGRRNCRYIDQSRFGLEAWIGRHCRLRESECLFLDNCGNLYDREYWEQHVWPAWNQRHAIPLL